jgi:hypothetical protein
VSQQEGLEGRELMSNPLTDMLLDLEVSGLFCDLIFRKAA